MLNLMLQVQMLLAALSAFLPLVPEEQRTRAAAILEFAAQALAAGGAVAVNVDDLAKKLAEVRAEVEAMAATGRAVTGEDGCSARPCAQRIGGVSTGAGGERVAQLRTARHLADPHVGGP